MGYAATAGNQVTSDAFGPVYNDNTIVIVMVGLLGLIIGMVVCSVFLRVLRSAIATVMVCFCEQPQALARHLPELYEQMRVTYGTRLGFVSWGPGPAPV